MSKKTDQEASVVSLLLKISVLYVSFSKYFSPFFIQCKLLYHFSIELTLNNTIKMLEKKGLFKKHKKIPTNSC